MSTETKKEGKKTKISGTILKSWIDATPDVTIEKIANIFGIQAVSLRNNLLYNNSKESYLSSTQLYTLVGHYPDFPYMNYGYKQEDFGFKTGDIKLLHFPSLHKADKRQEYNKKVEKYFDELIFSINNIKEEIAIYDYLIHNETLGSQKIYRNKNKQYLGSILQQCIKNEKIEYSRILVLPKDHYTHSARNIKEAISLLGYESYEHIISCFQEIPKRFNLFFCSMPVNPYSIGYFDNDKIIMELHKYVNKIAYPSKIFIFNKGNEEVINNMIEADIANIYQMLGEGKNPLPPFTSINLSDFQEATIDTFRYSKMKLQLEQRNLKKWEEKLNSVESEEELDKVKSERENSRNKIKELEHANKLDERKNDLVTKYREKCKLTKEFDVNILSGLVQKIGEKAGNEFDNEFDNRKNISNEEVIAFFSNLGMKIMDDFID